MIDWGYWVNKAKEYEDAGKYDEAIVYYSVILEDDPEDTFALTSIGSCFSRSGQFGQAVIYLDKAIDIKPWDSYLWFNKGVVYYENKRYGEAITYFDKAISLNENDAISWKFKAWCYQDLMDISKAIECFEISYGIDHDERTLDFIYELKQIYPFINSNSSSGSGKKQCPSCGRMVNEVAVSCGFCGHTFGNDSGIIKKCPNCGTAVRKNKKLCPKCNYDFKKSGRKKHNKNKPIKIKHFDNNIVSFDYPDNYSEDFNLKYEKFDIIASFKTGPQYDYDSAFAIFGGEPIFDEIPDSKFKEVIKKSLDSDVLNINRYTIAETERIIIKAQNKTNGNTEYICNIPEIGFSILFVIPVGKDYLFDEKWISTIVDSLERSTGKSISKKEVVGKREVVGKKEVKICSNCGAENSDDSNFCIECGVKLDVAKGVNFCIHCGTEVVPGARFCMNCGKLIED